MRLKKLEIFGFKSFADKTVISFEQGVTAIVGPNGCGKSNISDSIRWVLGEKSAKTLRGGKMEDLIFAGTQARKPLGFAEVSLTITNEDRRFPLDFDEVVLTRRLYRSGESEYLLNKTQCRLKDIRDILMNTGVGSNAYSMVEQGQIDYIVKAKANDRRFLIEEAAGISKYKNKKEEALRKLKRTDYNLDRVRDILSEVEKNIKYSERQARKAERYKKHFEELKRLELVRAKKTKSEVDTELAHITEEMGGLEGREAELELKLNEYRTGLQRIETELEELENEQRSFEERRFSNKSEITTIKDKKTFNHEKIAELADRNENLQNEIAISGERIKSLEEDVELRRAELEAFYEKAEGERGELEQVRMRYEEAVRELFSHKERVTELTNRMNEREDKISALREEYHELQNKRAGLFNQKENIQENSERVHAEEEEIISKLEISREEVERILKDYNQAKSSLDETTHRRGKLSTELSDLQENILNKRGELREIESQIKALEEFIASQSVFKEGTKSLISDSQAEDSPFFKSINTVLDSVDVHEGYEHAVQAALADCLYAVVAGDSDKAHDILNYTKTKDSGSVDIYFNIGANNAAHDGFPECVCGTAEQFVNLKTENSDAVKNLLSRILIVNDLERESLNALSHLFGQYHIVSLGGDVITKDGLVKHREEKEFLAGALVQEEQRKKHEHKKNEVLAEIEGLGQKEVALKAQREQLSEEINILSDDVINKKITLESNEKMSASIKESLTKLQERKNILKYEAEQTDESLSGLEEESLSLQSERDALNDKLRDEADELKLMNSQLAEKEKSREEIQLEIAALETRCNAIREKEEYLKNSVNIVELNCDNEKRTLEKNKDEIALNKQRVADLHTENESMDERLETCMSEFDDVESVLGDVKEKRSQLAEERNLRKEQTQELSTEYDSAKETLHKLNVKEVELNYKRQSMSERLQTAYKIDIDDFDFSTVSDEEVSFDSIDDDISTLIRKVESLGTVNMLAIEEYEELKERYDFLSTQKNDLESAKTSLHEAIRKINKTTKQLFLDVFAMVQRNFKEYYQILFNGGIAELILVDEDHPLESGIEIMVRPPGKKLQNISLLSGGEKAMTAVALLFALFKVKPSPFCVLDEVDAPLDEANIDRFLRVVREFIDSTQFVIVTHNRKTIGIADTLFGVTMQEAGVSKIVSVRIGDVGVDKNALPGEEEGETHNFNKESVSIDQTLDEIFKEVK